MATTIKQELLYNLAPVGQQIIFTIANDPIVNSNFNVKFSAAVHISAGAINLSNNNDLIGTFKTTPNGEGVGMFDLQPILETFLKPDHEAYNESFLQSAEYKGTNVFTKQFPIHLVDKYSLSENSITHFGVNFYVEYSTTPLGPLTSDINNPAMSDQYTIINGVVQDDDVIDIFTASAIHSLGFNLYPYYLSGPTKSFLTDSPTTQYAALGDYGTFPFLNIYAAGSTPALGSITISYRDSAGSSLGTDAVPYSFANGGYPPLGFRANPRLNYFGVFPGNLENWSSNFTTAVAGGLDYYTVTAVGVGSHPVILSKTYTIKIICPIKGYTPIRLTWLNKWGGWDYYTFSMKSTRTIDSKRIPYNQESGTWDESTFKIKGYKGGKKNFRVNSTEKIKINTDFVAEEEGVWFEQLTSSVEVYVLESFQSDGSFSSYNTYVQPVTLTTSSYTRKTIANDKLMQYTFEIEKSKMKRTQAV